MKFWERWVYRAFFITWAYVGWRVYGFPGFVLAGVASMLLYGSWAHWYHVCWPWVDECGRVLRLYVALPWGHFEMGFHPDAKVQRYDLKARRWTDEWRWWTWVPNR